MVFTSGFVLAVAILILAIGAVTRSVLSTLIGRREGGASTGNRLAKMEERVQRIEEATSGIVAEFAAVRERERFMTQLVESRARSDARLVQSTASSNSTPTGASVAGEPSPFVVQTVSAVRRAAVKPAEPV